MPDKQNQFTDEEIARLRKILEIDDRLVEIVKSDDRARWFWSTFRVWALTAATLIAPVLLAWDRLVDYIKAH